MFESKQPALIKTPYRKLNISVLSFHRPRAWMHGVYFLCQVFNLRKICNLPKILGYKAYFHKKYLIFLHFGENKTHFSAPLSINSTKTP